MRGRASRISFHVWIFSVTKLRPTACFSPDAPPSPLAVKTRVSSRPLPPCRCKTDTEKASQPAPPKAGHPKCTMLCAVAQALPSPCACFTLPHRCRAHGGNNAQRPPYHASFGNSHWGVRRTPKANATDGNPQGHLRVKRPGRGSGSGSQTPSADPEQGR